MTTLFDSVAGGRPEHVAKGALIYILRRSPGLLAWISSQCGRKSAIDVSRTVVKPEVPEGENGWRADIVIAWPEEDVSALELKLGAPFTPKQHRALVAGEIDLVIAPDLSWKGPITRGAKVVTWRQIIDNAPIKNDDKGIEAALLLLIEANDAYGWYREKIGRDDLYADAAAMFDGTVVSGRSQRDWVQSYRFLYQLDAYFHECVPEGWRYRFAGDRIAKPNRTYAYYGFDFRLAPDPLRAAPYWWLGLNRVDGKLGFRLYLDGKDLKNEWSIEKGLLARTVVQGTLDRIRSHHSGRAKGARSRTR